MTTIGSFSQPYHRMMPQFGCAARKVGFAGNSPVGTIGLDVSQLSMPKREELASQIRRAARGNVSVSRISIEEGPFPQPGRDKHFIAVEHMGYTIFREDVLEKVTALAKTHQLPLFTSPKEFSGPRELQGWLQYESSVARA